MPYAAYLAPWGCEHICNTRVHNGKPSECTHWGYHYNLSRLPFSWEGAGFGEVVAESN